MDPQMSSSIGAGYETEPTGNINANIYQIAKLNNLLPPGYRIELYENLGKSKGLELKSGKRRQIVWSALTY